MTVVFTLPTWELVFAFTLEAIPAVPCANEVEAERTVALVLVLTAEAIPAVAVFVFPFTTLAMDEEAVAISDCTASDPVLKLAPVRVRVPLDHTSLARVPKLVRVRVPAAHTLVGIFVIANEIDESVVARPAVPCAKEVEAARTVAFVLVFTVDAIPEVCELVFALT